MLLLVDDASISFQVVHHEEHQQHLTILNTMLGSARQVVQVRLFPRGQIPTMVRSTIVTPLAVHCPAALSIAVHSTELPRCTHTSHMATGVCAPIGCEA
jgi:hypothetical protein